MRLTLLSVFHSHKLELFGTNPKQMDILLLNKLLRNQKDVVLITFQLYFFNVFINQPFFNPSKSERNTTWTSIIECLASVHDWKN